MSRLFVIAECGVNHNGSLQNAKRLIEAAKDAGADAAKFQLFNSQKLWGDDRIKHLELRFSDMDRLYDHCKQVGIEFMCTPFGVEELTVLTPLLKRIKIASGCIGRKPLLEAAHATQLPVVLSTGMSTIEDIHDALEILLDDVTLLHCTSAYPCHLEDVNLNAMDDLLEFACPVGYSDHTNGITIAIAAVAKGAVMIEKHMTLDRNQEGPDHKTSITPREFKTMRMALGEVEAALGDGKKRVLDCELKLREAWRGN